MYISIEKQKKKERIQVLIYAFVVVFLVALMTFFIGDKALAFYEFENFDSYATGTASSTLFADDLWWQNGTNAFIDGSTTQPSLPNYFNSADDDWGFNQAEVPTSTQLTLTFWTYLYSATVHRYISFGTTTVGNGNIQFEIYSSASNPKIYWNNRTTGEYLCDVPLEEWFKIRFALATTEYGTGTAKVYINDVLCGADYGLFTNDYLRTFNISYGSSGGSRYDDLAFYSLDDTTGSGCYLWANETACYAHGCQWDYADEVCVYDLSLIHQCGNYQYCVLCESEIECEANESCQWHEGMWDRLGAIITGDEYYKDGCSWNTEIQPVSTSTTYEMGIEESFRYYFGKKLPFAYYYYIRDTLDTFALAEASGTIATSGIYLTIPHIVSGSTTITTTTTIPLLDMTLFFKIMPLANWNIIRELIALTIWVSLGFWIYTQIKRENLF